MTIAELLGLRPKARAAEELPMERPTRCVIRSEDLTDEMIEDFRAADYSHLNPELDQLRS